MNLRALMLATVAAVSISTPAMAQVVSEVEGKLIELNRQSRGVSQNLKVFGTRIFFKPTNGTLISTPTRDKIGTGALLNCNDARIPGFPTLPAGGSMVGGTAIVTGISNGNGTVIADTVFVEPAENVLLGQVTNVPIPDPDDSTNTKFIGKLEIDGTEIVVIGKKQGDQFPPAPKDANGVSTEIWNACFPGKGVKNAFSIEIPPTKLQIGTGAAAEGWFGTDDKFYAFLIEGEGSVEGQPLAAGISVAQCRNRGGARGLEWDIRGGVGHPSNALGSVTFGRQLDDGTGTLRYRDYGIATPIVVDPVDAKYGTFRIDVDVVGTDATAGCPEDVIVRYTPTNPVPPTIPPAPPAPKFAQARLGVDAR